MQESATLPANPVTSANGFLDGWKMTKKMLNMTDISSEKVSTGVSPNVAGRYIFVLSIARLKEIMISVCFVGDFGWERLSCAGTGIMQRKDPNYKMTYGSFHHVAE